MKSVQKFHNLRWTQNLGVLGSYERHKIQYGVISTIDIANQRREKVDYTLPSENP